MNMVRAAFQKADPQLTFQPLHLLAQPRLHDVLPLRSPAEMQLLGQRHAVAKLRSSTPAAKSVYGPPPCTP